MICRSVSISGPPIHDVLRLAHFLAIAPDEIQRAVFDDAGVAPTAADVPHRLAECDMRL
jgi:hypothetical protein